MQRTLGTVAVVLHHDNLADGLIDSISALLQILRERSLSQIADVREQVVQEVVSLLQLAVGSLLCYYHAFPGSVKKWMEALRKHSLSLCMRLSSLQIHREDDQTDSSCCRF